MASWKPLPNPLWAGIIVSFPVPSSGRFAGGVSQ